MSFPRPSAWAAPGVNFVSTEDALKIQSTYRKVDGEILATLKKVSKIGQI